MLRDENDQLKTAKTDLEGELTKAKAAAPLAAQAQTLREQLAQTQAQASALTEENLQLKTRLGTAANAPRLAAPTTTSGSTAPSPVTTSAPRPTGSPVTATFVVTPPGNPASAITRSPSSGGAPRYHTVTGGDTLSKISTAYYGTPGRWAEILVANRDVLGEDNNLVIGRQLRIP